MKALKWIGLAVVVLIVIGIIAVALGIDPIVRAAVEKGTSQTLDVPASLDGADVSLFSGNVELRDYVIGAPEGFSADLFQMGGLNVDVGYGQLLGGNTKRVKSIRVASPQVTLEQKNGKFNFQALTAMGDGSDTPAPAEGGEPMKLIIDDLQITDAKVSIRPNLPGLQEEYAVTVPSLKMLNIGTGEGAENGAAIGVVLKQVATALAAEAMKSGNLPPELEQLMSLNIDQAVSQLKGVAQEKLNAVVDDARQQVDAKVEDAVGQVGGEVDKAKEKLNKGIGGLLGDNKDKPAEGE